jgi:hypothetical protein
VGIALAPNGRWPVARGEVPGDRLRDVADELYPAEIARWSIRCLDPAA